MYIQHLLYKFSCFAEEETMDFTNFTLDASYQLQPTSSFHVIGVSNGGEKI